MKTGFKNLDNKIKLNNGELIIIAATACMGKTTFVSDIMDNVAIKQNKGVLFFSLETSKESLWLKSISNNATIENSKVDLFAAHQLDNSLDISKLTEEDIDRITYGKELLKNAPIYIEDKVPYTIEDIRKKSREMKLNKDIDLIIIDYVQLVLGDNEELSRAEEIEDILMKLKILAKELNVPIIVTSYLSAKIERRENKRPFMSDFSNVGFLTYSDIVLFIYREPYDNKNRSNVAEIIIAKNRDGGTGIVKLAWIPEYRKFGNAIFMEDKNEDK